MCVSVKLVHTDWCVCVCVFMCVNVYMRSLHWSWIVSGGCVLKKHVMQDRLRRWSRNFDEEVRIDVRCGYVR